MTLNLRNYLPQAWLVLLLAVTLGGALALVERSLEGRIAAHTESRLRQAVFEVVPQGADSRLETIDGQAVYRVTDQAGGLAGWAVPAETMGFVDKIQLMIGLDATAQRITGLVVLASKETPGLGEKIRTPEFRQEFVGQPATATLEVVKPGRSAEHPIQAITGATISSQAVTAGVNQRLASIRDAVAAQARGTANSRPAGAETAGPGSQKEVTR